MIDKFFKRLNCYIGSIFYNSPLKRGDIAYFCDSHRNFNNEVFMLLIDDILLSPAKGLFYIFKQIHKAAEEEFLNEENVSAELSELYMMLETGKITEEEFNNKESELLNRLEQIEEYKKKHFEVVDEREESEDEDEVRNVVVRKNKKRTKSSRNRKNNE